MVNVTNFKFDVHIPRVWLDWAVFYVPANTV